MGGAVQEPSGGKDQQIPEYEREYEQRKAALERKDAKLGCGLVIGLVAVVAIVIVAVTSGGKRPEDVKLTAHAATGGGEVRITNGDSFAWFDIELKLNGEYRYARDSLSAGANFTVALREFTNDTGQRFNWLTTKPLEIFITACVRSSDGTSSVMCGSSSGMHWGNSGLTWQ